MTKKLLLDCTFLVEDLNFWATRNHRGDFFEGVTKNLEQYNEIYFVYFKNIFPDGLDDEVTIFFKFSLQTFPMLCRQDIYLTPRLLITTDVALIASWIDKKKEHLIILKIYLLNLILSVICRASRDGFGIDKFHKHCDNKGPTVLITTPKRLVDIIH
ncbi:hypothetical protein RhiirC2_790110 [Rhizophagus irregularis]|uniref:Uncharacterized protein n=1 Tax=Rhizophagus irregularis TaxID=588596 RepID=A0A2N1MLW2_9GLOM|nr:hypothetical protein RhiirC2_790110 [Rhizophagus irregularis]